MPKSQHLSHADPVPLRNVRLKPSIFASAVGANRRYLLSLDPERLLHNFYTSAGLPAPAPRYGGWESASIAGHTLGHWLSACATLVGNTGDAEIAARLDQALAGLAKAQRAEGDGFVGGITAMRDGKEVSGKRVFEEIRRGDIRATWALNDAWVPIYTQHKVLAGLLDAFMLAGRRAALPIATGLAGYMAGVFDALTDDQLQKVLSVEHGGILESYVELFMQTGNRRWLAMGRRLQHHAVIDPLIAGEDVLSGLHANTQIPKLIGMARLYEAGGDPAHSKAASFFHRTVTGHHSYVLGGNSEREHFGPADRQGEQLTTATCEACNSYNMLKLTRHLYSWEPDARLFDYYERTQLNHIMAHQRPDDGRFVYFMPLESGAKRDYSTAEDSFWCCVGSGMESHAKHADSIYWTDDRGALLVNLFIPSTLDTERFALDLDTRYPDAGRVALSLRRAPRGSATIAIRRPGWAAGAVITVNDEAMPAMPVDGYWRIERQWRKGDRIEVTLPMTVRSEPLPGARDTYALLSGPLVLAADLAPAAERFDGPAPALLASAGQPQSAMRPTTGTHRFAVTDVLGNVRQVAPFYDMYDRRAAVYFRTFTPESWTRDKDAYLADEAARADLSRRTIDIFHIGEMQPERDHGFEASAGGPGEFYGKKNRSLPEGAQAQFRLARRPGPAVLQLTFWGNDIDRDMTITVDDREIAVERRAGPARAEWVVVDYLVPATTKDSSLVRITARKGAVIYGVRIVQPQAGLAAAT